MIEKILFCEFNKPEKVVQMPLSVLSLKISTNLTETLYSHLQLNYISKCLRIRAPVAEPKAAGHCGQGGSKGLE